MLIYRADIFSMTLGNRQKWPLFGLALVAFQTIAPIYILISRANAEGISAPDNEKLITKEYSNEGNQKTVMQNQDQSCPSGTDICIRSSTGGTVRGIHIDGFASCADRHHLSAKADTGGIIDDVNSKNRILMDCRSK